MEEVDRAVWCAKEGQRNIGVYKVGEEAGVTGHRRQNRIAVGASRQEEATEQQSRSPLQPGHAHPALPTGDDTGQNLLDQQIDGLPEALRPLGRPFVGIGRGRKDPR